MRMAIRAQTPTVARLSARAAVFAGICSCLVVLGADHAASADASSRASLRLVKKAPVTLAGANFKPRERVRVVAARDAERFVRTVTASAAGAFTVSYSGVTIDPCNATFRATGNRGSRAVVKLPERMCPVTLGPGR